MDVASLLSVGALLMQAIATAPAACNEGVDAGCAPSDDGLTSLVQLTKVSADRRSKKATDVKSNVKKDAPLIKYVPIGNGSRHTWAFNASDQYMDLSELVFSNLGEQGPDQMYPEGMRFKNVYMFFDGDFRVDLLVNAVTEYLPSNVSVNGHVGNVGAINMQGGTSTTFQFSLLYSYCYEGYALSRYYGPGYYGDHYGAYYSLVGEGVAKESAEEEEAEEEEDKEDENIKLSGYYGYSDDYVDYYSEGCSVCYAYYDDYYFDYYYGDCDYYGYYCYYYEKYFTCEPVPVNRLLVSIYDIDNGRKKYKEVVQASHYEHAYLSNDTTLKVVKEEGHVQTQFRSTSRDPSWRGQKIPEDLETLTAHQKNHAVTLKFKFTSTWQVTFSSVGGTPVSRNFFFSGIPVFPSCVDHDEPKDLVFDKVTYCNLGGLGPDLESPEGIRFEKVVMLNGKFLDLIVTSIELDYAGETGASFRRSGTVSLGDHLPPPRGDPVPVSLGDHLPPPRGDPVPVSLGDHLPPPRGDPAPNRKVNLLDDKVLLGDSLAPPLLGNPALSGVFNGIGAISMVTATKAKFNFTFVQSDDDAPACVDDFMFSVLDMHPLASMPSFQEKITLSNVAVAYLAEGSEISVETLEGGETVFLGPTAGDNFMPSRNDCLMSSFLDAEQERRSVTVNFKNVCNFEMEIDLTSADAQEQYTTYFQGTTGLVNSEVTVSCQHE